MERKVELTASERRAHGGQVEREPIGCDGTLTPRDVLHLSGGRRDDRLIKSQGHEINRLIKCILYVCAKGFSSRDSPQYSV